jgi:GNAT superfamily N-acetyltransferase
LVLKIVRNPEIVLLEASQIQLASELLAKAFKDDPLFQQFTDPEELRRLSSLQSMGTTMLNYAHPHHAVYTTTEAAGVAIWIPPHHFPLDEFRLLRAGGYALPFTLRLSKLIQSIPLFFKIEACHKAWMSQPHWYLLMLGVDPAWQNRGVGGALLQPILDRADRDNLPCYLETSTAAAVRFYQRHGFEVVETIDSAPNDIWIWAMKREPI